MIHPDSELRLASEAVGLGVFATRAIPKGTIIWALDELDQRFTPERAKRLGPRYAALLDRYGYLTASGDRVVCWDLARWINHSCDANVISTGWDFDVAIRDIRPGEEICNDYGALNLEESFACHCGGPTCRRRVHPADFERLADRWDANMREVFPQVLRVPQPLWNWVPTKRRVAAAARDPRRLPSVRAHRLAAPAEEPARAKAARGL